MTNSLQSGDSPDQSIAIELRSVDKSYDGQSVLQSIDLVIRSGEFLSLVGPSGCGKSTLLRLLADLDQPTSGEIDYSEWIRHGRHGTPSTGFVFQEPNLLPWLNVFDNVALPFRVSGQSFERKSVVSILERVGIDQTDFHKLPKQLSGGMKMRVSIARSLVVQPRVLLMDEPFAALDELLRAQLNQDLLKIWTENRLTAVFVTHNLPEAIFVSERIAVMTGNQTPLKLFDIPFDYPRTRTIRTSTQFAQLHSEISEFLEAHHET